MVQTIDVTPGCPATLCFSSWEEVAAFHEVSARAIKRDREAFGRDEEPINPELLDLIAKMRRCLELGVYSRRRIVKWYVQGLLDQKIKAFESLNSSKPVNPS